MNRASLAQETRASSSLPPTQGILQRKCACGNKIIASGECTECAKKNNGLQRKLVIGASNDPLEREADRVADQMMGMPEPKVQRQEHPEEEFIQTKPLAKAITPLAQRQVTDGEEELLQAKIAGDVTPEVTPVISSGIQSLQGGGHPLSGSERSFFEPRFGADFSKVRVHNGTRAENAARSVNARAFTLGHNVVFGAGEYSSDTLAGRKLLAHELTHVVQQSGKPINGKSMLKQHLLHDAPFAIRRKELFSSTMKICHRILKSRTFKVSQGSVSVIADAEWIGPGTKQCGAAVYPMTLAEEGIIFDSERESCDFRVNRADIQTWTNVPSGDYRLTIWPNNTNPHCCLNGTIKVLEQSGVKGPSCGGRARNEKALLDVLHLALDGAGMFPALGVIPDAVNATIYLIEGDWINAGVSAGAMVPIFGQGVTVTKLGVKVTAKAVERLGKEGIEQGLKKAAQKEAAERAAKKAAKEKAAKEAAETTGKKPKKPSKKKSYLCTAKCQSNGGPGGAYFVPGISPKDCSTAVLVAKASIPRGEYPRHCSCIDTKGFRGNGVQCEKHRR